MPCLGLPGIKLVSLNHLTTQLGHIITCHMPPRTGHYSTKLYYILIPDQSLKTIIHRNLQGMSWQDQWLNKYNLFESIQWVKGVFVEDNIKQGQGLPATFLLHHTWSMLCCKAKLLAVCRFATVNIKCHFECGESTVLTCIYKRALSFRCHSCTSQCESPGSPSGQTQWILTFERERNLSRVPTII